MDIIQKNMGEKQVQIIIDLYHEALEQNEMKIPDYMQYHIFQKFDTKSMVVILDSNISLHKSSESREYQFIDFTIDRKRIMIQFNPLIQNDSKVNCDVKDIHKNSLNKARMKMKNGTNNLNINLIMKSDHSQLLQSKREEFRFQIRKERLEDLFSVHRKTNVDQIDLSPIIQIPQFSESIDLHKYLIDGEFKQQKLLKAARDPNLMTYLINNANRYDYYSILILNNICSLENIENVEQVFLNQLKVAQQKSDIKMIANIFNALESLCSQQLTKNQFEYLHQNNLFNLINETLKQHLHEVYTDEEISMIQSGTGALCRFMHQFKDLTEQEQAKLFQELKYEMQSTIFLMKKFLPIQIQHSKQVFLFLKNILQILLFHETLVEQLDNRFLQNLVKFLDFSDNEILIITTLRMMIYLSSLDDEKFVQRLFYLKGHDVVKQYINHESLNIRQAAIKTLANFANSQTELVKKELVSDSAFLVEVIQNFSNTSKSDQDLLRLICGIIDNCMTYVPSEIIEDLCLPSKVRSKFMCEDLWSMNVETLIIYLRVLITLIIYYRVYFDDDKELIVRIEKLIEFKNTYVSELAEEILEVVNPS